MNQNKHTTSAGKNFIQLNRERAGKSSSRPRTKSEDPPIIHPSMIRAKNKSVIPAKATPAPVQSASLEEAHAQLEPVPKSLRRLSEETDKLLNVCDKALTPTKKPDEPLKATPTRVSIDLPLPLIFEEKKAEVINDSPMTEQSNESLLKTMESEFNFCEETEDRKSQRTFESVKKENSKFDEFSPEFGNRWQIELRSTSGNRKDSSMKKPRSEQSFHEAVESIEKPVFDLIKDDANQSENTNDEVEDDIVPTENKMSSKNSIQDPIEDDKDAENTSQRSEFKRRSSMHVSQRTSDNSETEDREANLIDTHKKQLLNSQLQLRRSQRLAKIKKLKEIKQAEEQRSLKRKPSKKSLKRKKEFTN